MRETEDERGESQKEKQTLQGAGNPMQDSIRDSRIMT